MNTVLYFKELKRNRKNAFIWGAIVVGFTLMILAIFPSFSQMGDQITELMASVPAEFSKALGMDEETWSSIIGFYGTYYGIYITLLMGIFTASTGATIIGKEERDGTAEFLLTRPISRGTIVKSKYAALVTLFVGIYVVQTVFAAVGMVVFGENVAWDVFTTMHIHGFVLIGFFTAAGVLMSSFLSPKLNYMGPVVGMIFGCFFLDAISNAADAVSWMGYISPYHYLKLQGVNGVLETNWAVSVVMLAVAAGLLTLAYFRYLKKDIVG